MNQREAQNVRAQIQQAFREITDQCCPLGQQSTDQIDKTVGEIRKVLVTLDELRITLRNLEDGEDHVSKLRKSGFV